ncbi:MAG: ABC transporter ATP-binding protein [Clostridiales bacterium]|nr:ABC transporter ATP-binding protein [Clostridiales bacterium]
MPGGRRGQVQQKPKDTKATMKRIIKYLKVYKTRLFFVFVCVLISSVTTLAGSYMIRPILNSVVAGDGVGVLVRNLVMMGCIYALCVGATFCQKQVIVKISQSVLYTMRKDLFDRLQKLPVRYFDNHTTGEIMSRFANDIDNIGNMLDNSITVLMSSIISFAGTLALMIYTNIWLTLITIVMLPVMLKTSTGILKHSQKFFKSQQAALAAANGYIEEIISGQKVVKVFNHEEIAKKEFGQLNRDLKEKQVKAQFLSGIVMPVNVNLNSINYALNTVVGAYLCIAHGFDIGGLAVSINYSRQFGRPVNELSNQMSVILSALAGAERVFAVLDTEQEPEDAPDAKAPECIRGDVVLKNVYFGYRPDKMVLKNISLYARPGQKIAFAGSTGAGKTTITNLLTRFYDISQGEITIDGIPLERIKKDCLRAAIAMVLQDTHLFTGTVMENIRYGRLDATDEEVVAAAKIANADSFIRHLPEGYQTVLAGDGSNLSQGQRQLLNIARAAVSKAPILILDEATSSVDTRTERQIDKGMDELMKGRTTFVIAHRLSTVRNADAIMVLENGEIIERGSHEELLRLRGRYYELSVGKAELN